MLYWIVCYLGLQSLRNALRHPIGAQRDHLDRLKAILDENWYLLNDVWQEAGGSLSGVPQKNVTKDILPLAGRMWFSKAIKSSTKFDTHKRTPQRDRMAENNSAGFEDFLIPCETA
jgi:hypothetical protein